MLTVEALLTALYQVNETMFFLSYGAFKNSELPGFQVSTVLDRRLCCSPFVSSIVNSIST